MPTIRRPPRPTWRARKFFGYECEALISRSNIDLECDRWFYESDLTNEARELFLKLQHTIWFIRLPSERNHFATLVKQEGHHAPTRAILEEAGKVPLTAGPPVDEFQFLKGSTYHYSFIAGRVKAYLNGNPEWCWDGVRDYLDHAAMPREDREFFKDV